jgi:hypothetical protein
LLPRWRREGGGSGSESVHEVGEDRDPCSVPGSVPRYLVIDDQACESNQISSFTFCLVVWILIFNLLSFNLLS